VKWQNAQARASQAFVDGRFGLVGSYDLRRLALLLTAGAAILFAHMLEALKWPGTYSICQLSSAPISLPLLSATGAGPFCWA
jgi:hypothetical protein